MKTVAKRIINVEDEITVNYGTDYFGDDNERSFGSVLGTLLCYWTWTRVGHRELVREWRVETDWETENRSSPSLRGIASGNSI